MPNAASLTEAANISYQQLSLAWAALSLRTKWLNFVNAAKPLFEDAVPNDRPVGNWIILMQSLYAQMDAGLLPQDQFNAAVDLSYRVCLAAATARASNLISSAQATALLDAWNAQFGT